MDGLGSGAMAHGHAPPEIVAATKSAFVSALGSGLTLGGIVTLVGAVVAWLLVAPRPAARPEGAPAAAPSMPGPSAEAEAIAAVEREPAVTS